MANREKFRLMVAAGQDQCKTQYDIQAKELLTRVQMVIQGATGIAPVAGGAFQLASLEGEIKLLNHVEKVLEHIEAEDQEWALKITLAISEILARGADDSWSGRTNDVKRAEFDGTRDRAQRLIGHLQFSR